MNIIHKIPQDLIKIIKDNNFETIVDYICSLSHEQILELSNKLKQYQEKQNSNINKLLEEKLKNSNNNNKNNEILKLINKKNNLINLMQISKYYDNDDISKNLKEYELLSDIEKQLLK